jgi:hypothetical protein
MEVNNPAELLDSLNCMLDLISEMITLGRPANGGQFRITRLESYGVSLTGEEAVVGAARIVRSLGLDPSPILRLTACDVISPKELADAQVTLNNAMLHLESAACYVVEDMPKVKDSDGLSNATPRKKRSTERGEDQGGEGKEGGALDRPRETTPASREKWITATEAAKASGCYRWEITRAVNSGSLKSNGEKGRKRRIDAADLTLWQLRRAASENASESPEAVERKLKRARGPLQSSHLRYRMMSACSSR